MFGFGKSNKKEQDGYTRFIKESPRKLSKQFGLSTKEVRATQKAVKKAGRDAFYK